MLKIDPFDTPENFYEKPESKEEVVEIPLPFPETKESDWRNAVSLLSGMFIVLGFDPPERNTLEEEINDEIEFLQNLPEKIITEFSDFWLNDNKNLTFNEVKRKYIEKYKL